MAKGISFILEANTGTEAVPVWTKVAGQRGGTLNRSKETIDNTSKDTDGWVEKDYGLGEWGIDADGLLVESDAGYRALEDAFMNNTILQVRWVTGAGHKYTGKVLITDFPQEGPYDGEATYSVTLEGTGKPVKTLAV